MQKPLCNLANNQAVKMYLLVSKLEQSPTYKLANDRGERLQKLWFNKSQLVTLWYVRATL